jgi:rhodanese-related sulfurtransferase
MAIRQIDPEEAHGLMADGHVYLDVRSTAEFARGHATGALNVPLLEHDRSGALAPNPDFLAVCLATLPKDARLVVGCAAGGRSQRACEMLGEQGYTTLANLRGGFGGQRDRDGRLVAKGWVDSGLPVSTEVGDDVSYASLARKAGK